MRIGKVSHAKLPVILPGDASARCRFRRNPREQAIDPGERLRFDKRRGMTDPGDRNQFANGEPGDHQGSQ